MSVYVITGATRGLGLELARQALQSGHHLIACGRILSQALQSLGDQHPSHYRFVPLDLLDSRSIDTATELIGDRSIDVLVNNAGVLFDRVMQIGKLDYDAWIKTLAVNTLAPVRLVEKLLDNLSTGNKKVIASISSELGSIGNNDSGGYYLYRSSKAALNAAMKSIAVDLAPRGIASVMLHPGWVRTEMGGPEAPLEVQDAGKRLFDLIDGLTMGQSGKFLHINGSEIPW